jgi:putative pyruvate formate lyase activating enzyme
MLEPGYRKLSENGELKKRIGKAYKILEECSLCPRKCKINRLNGELGYCKSGKELKVSSFGPHFGEEPPLVGRFGSGTIFLTNCNLGCLYCQNYDISHLGQGEEVSLEELAGQMPSLQKRGCHNINFVTPTHFVPQIIASLARAIEKGLNVPLVYNCGGYESLEVLKLLEGIFDIYMPDIKYPDIKYANEEVSKKYSNAGDYPDVVKEALLEMQRQVGDLIIDERGIAQRGLLIRHLVLPNQLAGTKEIMHFIAKEISPSAYVNIMDQYRPCYKAINYPQLSRGITREEYEEAVEIASQEGLSRGFST